MSKAHDYSTRNLIREPISIIGSHSDTLEEEFVEIRVFASELFSCGFFFGDKNAMGVDEKKIR